MLILLGYAIQLVSLLVAVFPKAVLEETSKIKVTTRLRLLEGAAWVLLGVTITWHTQSTKFPLGVLTVGILSIGLGTAALLISNSRMHSLRNWLLLHGPNTIRTGGIAGLLCGGFLSYAA